MAETSTPPPAHDAKPQPPHPPNPNSHPPNPEPQANSAPPQQPSSTPTPSLTANPNSAPPAFPLANPSPVNPYAPHPPIGSSGAVFPPPAMPSFRPAGAPAPISTPQFTPVLSNPNLPGYQPQGPGVPPPGVSSAPGIGAPPPMVPGGMYQSPLPGQPPNPLLRPQYMPMPNGYMPPGVPQGTIPPPGVPRYPYQSIVRPAFPLRPPGTVGVPLISRPPMLGIRPPLITSIVRPPVVPVVAPVEKPQTTVYVGKISSTVENDFMLSLLQFCGPVKSWKRPQDPSNGTPKSFGFCEFESPEGVLRSLRLLSKLNIDGQDLMLNVNQATKDYLERYVEKKKGNSKPKELEEKETKEEDIAKVEKGDGDEVDQPKPSVEESQDKNESGSKENDMSTFGLVSDEDHEADREATEKITNTIEERFKSRPLPPPPPPPQRMDVTTTSNSEGAAKSGEKDSDADVKKDDKNDDEMTSETKTTAGAGTESPDRGRRYDGRGRERDRDRDLKREKERELERIERERERERARRERDRELEIQQAERLYKERVKEWEAKEKEREYRRKYEKEREKEKERERRRLVQDQEDESDDDSRRRRRRSDVEGKRRKRQREREEDFADRLKEEEEIAEAKKKAEEEEEQQKQLQREALLLSSAPVANGKEKVTSPETDSSEIGEKGPEQIFDNYSAVTNDNGGGALENGSNDESAMTLGSESDLRPSGNAPAAKKLGFGLSGLGKRTTVLSVFNEEDDDDSHKDKKMRPLVPIDYSAEELQATLHSAPGMTPPNMASAADVAKRTTMGSKDERSDAERDRSRRSHDKSSHRDRDQKDHETSRVREESREKPLGREHGDKSKSSENKNVVDAKQLIDMIPKTKEELFAYDINWAVYDKHGLHERIRPWIVKKITEFLGEEEATLVDYIVSSIQDHIKASQMLDQLQSILDEEAEMFVLKMWRMLIFEIKRVEAGLVAKPKA